MCFGAHALMENRNGLCADFTLHNPITQSEPAVALQQLAGHEALHQGVNIKTVGADKGYHQNGFVQGCRERGIVPHVACKANVQVAGLDGRTTTQQSYQISLKIRKRVEEIFGWMKTVGGFRRTRYRGVERTGLCGYFVGTAYNLVRMSRLLAKPAAVGMAA
jgi:IS5 family transposase